MTVGAFNAIVKMLIKSDVAINPEITLLNNFLSPNPIIDVIQDVV
jgi:hypothetical protein